MIKKYFDYQYIESLQNYIWENIACLIVPIESLSRDTPYFTSYVSLLIDISEGYGAWTALLFLIVSALLVMITTEQLVRYTNSQVRNYFRSEDSSKVNKLSSENYFFSFNYYFRK